MSKINVGDFWQQWLQLSLLVFSFGLSLIRKCETDIRQVCYIVYDQRFVNSGYIKSTFKLLSDRAHLSWSVLYNSQCIVRTPGTQTLPRVSVSYLCRFRARVYRDDDTGRRGEKAGNRQGIGQVHRPAPMTSSSRAIKRGSLYLTVNLSNLNRFCKKIKCLDQD